jgi:hypothetical protein
MKQLKLANPKSFSLTRCFSSYHYPQFCEQELRNANVLIPPGHPASARIRRNPARGCLFIRGPRFVYFSFLFFSRPPVDALGTANRRDGWAAEKQKRKRFWSVISINRQPLAGFEDKLHSSSAFGDGGNDQCFSRVIVRPAVVFNCFNSLPHELRRPQSVREITPTQ